MVQSGKGNSSGDDFKQTSRSCRNPSVGECWWINVGASAAIAARSRARAKTMSRSGTGAHGLRAYRKGHFPDAANHFLRRLCNQCDVPPCVQVCPVQATVRREEDGVVVMYYGKCIGCGMCISACPYDARFFNPIRNTADKCDFCSARIDAGLQPSVRRGLRVSCFGVRRPGRSFQ